MDQIAGHHDVTSFLNDRFDPWFVAPEGVQGLPTELSFFLDLNGCLLEEPKTHNSPSEWIEDANRALIALQHGESFGPLKPEPEWGFYLPTGHPLFADCHP